MIQVRDLRVDYDDVCAVRDLTLQVPAGEVYGLIGPNGAGKTTTLRALVGLKEPTYGDVFLDGVDLFLNREEAVRGVGFMPDSAPIYEDLTVWEYLELFAASYLIPKDHRRPIIERHLELVDLTEKRTAMTAGLSRGMRQRLLLAKTLLPEPKIALLDEPASGVDPHGRILLKNVLRQLGAEGKAVIISSHILTELSGFCTSVGIMEKGRLVVSGRVEEVAAQVLGGVELQIEVLAGEAECAQVLEHNPHVKETRREGNLLLVNFEGDDSAASDLLGALVRSGVKVVSFARRQAGLEEVFLKVGAKEVS
jgi:ABC-2 type transport system ATP-binding protein